MLNNLTENQILNAYAICEGQCGAKALSTGEEDNLVDYFQNTDNPEHRFCGKLGFGGKLYYNNSRGFYVENYKEDKCAEIIDRANSCLDNFVNKRLV